MKLNKGCFRGETSFLVAKMCSIKTKKQKYKIKLFLSLSIALIFICTGNIAFADIKPSEVILLVNEARIGSGVSALKEDPVLMKAAREKAADMTMLQYFSHISPNGVSPWHWFEKNNYDYKYAGENLAINFTSAEDQQRAWMQSETHKKNILNPNYREIGVAIKEGYVNGKPAVVTVQLFGTKMRDDSVAAVGKVNGVSVEANSSQIKQFKSTALNSTYVLVVIAFIMLFVIGFDLFLIIRKQHHKTMIISPR